MTCVIGGRGSELWLFLAVFIKRDKDDNTRSDNGKNRRKIDCLSRCQQDVYQKAPEQDDADGLRVRDFATCHVRIR